MSTLETNLVQPSTGTTLTLGASGDTITIPSGATITNSGTASGFGGITEADLWTMTSNLSLSGNTETLISANLSRSDDTGSGLLGTGMSVSSGIWTFPSTGFYLVNAQVQHEQGSDSIYNGVRIYCTTNNSSYSNVSNANTSGKSGEYSNVSTSTIIDVTDTSNVKLKFYTIAQGGGTARGNSNYKYTGFYFIRLGDT